MGLKTGNYGKSFTRDGTKKGAALLLNNLGISLNNKI